MLGSHLSRRDKRGELFVVQLVIRTQAHRFWAFNEAPLCATVGSTGIPTPIEAEREKVESLTNICDFPYKIGLAHAAKLRQVRLRS